MNNLLRLSSSPIDSTEKENIIIKSKDLILSLCSPIKLILFGSALTDKFDAYSDLDFIVMFATPALAKDGQSKLYRSAHQFPTSVDFVCTDTETFERKSKIGGVMMIAAEDGRLLFERQQNLVK